MQNNGFQPFGPTVLVDENAVYQPQTTNGQNSTSYRVRNKTATEGWIAWAVPLAGNVAPTIAKPAAIVANTPGPNQIGMVASSVEVFVLPANAYFKASASVTFEVTPGEGI